MFESFENAFTNASSVLLTTTELDGDSVGAIAALYLIIKTRWPKTNVRILNEEGLPRRYTSIVPAGIHFGVAGDFAVQPIDLAVVVDGDRFRLGAATAHFDAAQVTGMIDHHRSSAASDVDIALHDPTAASTTIQVLELADYLEVPLTPDLARCIYAGLAFDTSVFRYRMTSPRTHYAAARLLETGIDHARVVECVLFEQTEAKARLKGRMLERMQRTIAGSCAWSYLTYRETLGEDTGGLVDDLVFLEGVSLGLLLVEKSDGTVKASLRGRGACDVGRLARRLAPQGGGHARAAGATLRGPMEDAITHTLAAIAEYVKADHAA
ncbi:MAG: DHH family phosphoesterase [Myxococcota bacterium]|nr:DHH family phosphoesterase [Myxococcota bacterium]